MATGRPKWSTSRLNYSKLCDAWLPRVHKHQINVQRNDFGNATTIYLLFRNPVLSLIGERTGFLESFYVH